MYTSFSHQECVTELKLHLTTLCERLLSKVTQYTWALNYSHRQQHRVLQLRSK